MNDPDDWYRDLQLIVDVLLSGGVPERRGGPPAGGSLRGGRGKVWRDPGGVFVRGGGAQTGHR